MKEGAEINTLKTPTKTQPISYTSCVAKSCFMHQRRHMWSLKPPTGCSRGPEDLSALALCGTWQPVVKNEQLLAFVNPQVPWQENGSDSNHAQFAFLLMSVFARTHANIRREWKRLADVQGAMMARLPTWRADGLTIKISKAIPTACWQLVQLFAPVSPHYPRVWNGLFWPAPATFHLPPQWHRPAASQQGPDSL